MKPELNPTQAIYPPEGAKPKVCVTMVTRPLQLLRSSRRDPSWARKEDRVSRELWVPIVKGPLSDIYN